MKQIILSLFMFWCSATLLWGQSIVSPVALDWSSETYLYPLPEGETIQTVSFRGASWDNALQLPYYTKRLLLPVSGNLVVKLEDAVFAPLDKPLPNNDKIPAYIAPTAKIGYEQKQPFALVSFMPIVKNTTGQVEKLISAKIHISIQPDGNHPAAKGSRNYTDNSILNQGDFYEFTVDQDGIYKLDYAFLSQIGISSTINFAQLRLYGNGGGMLPELAGAAKYDDLVENPIEVFDQNNNGIFENGDYILFYAQSPDQWYYNATKGTFYYQPHLYAHATTYFLNFDIGTGRRIATETPPTQPPTHTVNSFNGYVTHHNERINLMHSGRRWFGEAFGGIPQQTFSFILPNLITTEPVNIKAAVAARTFDAGSTFSFKTGSFTSTSTSIGVSGTRVESYYAQETIQEYQYSATGDQIDMTVTYNKPIVTAEGWLDYIEINARRQLRFLGGQMPFADAQSVGANNIARFVCANASSNLRVWDITEIDKVQNIALQTNNNEAIFTANAQTLRRYLAFDGSSFLSPIAGRGKIERQNLHAPISPDMIIVTHPDFMEAATRLAAHHQQHDYLNVLIATPQQIYNEFSSGTADVTAIRDFVKMFYDRAGANTDQLPRYLLLLGDASYDYKNIEIPADKNENFVPTVESNNSIYGAATYCTDDYYGFLDDNEGDNLQSVSALLDIAIGRFPAKTLEEALGIVDKNIHYATSPKTLGSWRSQITLISDDEDGNYYMENNEDYAELIEQSQPSYNINKIYCDAYIQEPTPGDPRYPTVNTDINNAVYNGSLIVNYVGHGGENGWAQERILSTSDVLAWNNYDRLPLFVTATCSFSRYDHPENAVKGLTSAGEHVVLNKEGGGVAIMTTTRLVYANDNRRMSYAFFERLFPQNVSFQQTPTIGEAARAAKNDVISDTSSPFTAINNRKFNLLGNPALRLSYPTQYEAITTHVNNIPIATYTDTIKALTHVSFRAEVRQLDNTLVENFNGTADIVVYDKAQSITTLNNDRTPSTPLTFKSYENVLFKGKATIQNGVFQYSFIIPKDINYAIGQGRVSYYITDGQQDGSGYTHTLTIGGIGNNTLNDNEPPTIQLFMNDEKFVFGGITNPNPLLVAKVKDESGINASGNGIGHDITAIIDDNTQNIITLNNYYQANTDSYQEGSIQYPLSNLAQGRHTLEVKVWDVNNLSNKGYTEFYVADDAALALDHVLNYPNPFVDQTSFWFEHNRPQQPLRVVLQVMTIGGRVVKTIQQEVVSEGNRVDNIQWDGLDDFGNRIGRGVYIYKLSVSDEEGTTAHKVEKLVILK